ncbi:MAG: GNAT family N-acetyltransferase [Chitinophagaceae bacterium]|nr:MAG: GNAT family N-acetyltransferase [Chitinophagaceae bacterium]
MKTIEWTLDDFNGLDTKKLYQILKTRAEVFVVEQQCNYLDPDGVDIQSMHLCGWQANELIAYARIIPAGIAYAEASIGRVLIRKQFRGNGTGKLLMQKSIEACKTLGNGSIHISAQYYLLDFYTNLGFGIVGEQYLEDDIPHIGMIYKN